MGIDCDPEYGGSGLSYFSTILAIEELARIDPAVCTFCDVHNTLVIQTIKLFGNDEQKKKYLPPLCKNKVSQNDNKIGIFRNLVSFSVLNVGKYCVY